MRCGVGVVHKENLLTPSLRFAARFYYGDVTLRKEIFGRS